LKKKLKTIGLVDKKKVLRCPYMEKLVRASSIDFFIFFSVYRNRDFGEKYPPNLFN